MRYLLDTNAVIELLKGSTGKLGIRVRACKPADVGISTVVAHELFYGAFKSQRLEQNVARVDALQFEVIPFDLEDARRAGEVRAALARQGTPIGPLDVLIAGQALARGRTLVSHNTQEFARIDGLLLEDWQA